MGGFFLSSATNILNFSTGTIYNEVLLDIVIQIHMRTNKWIYRAEKRRGIANCVNLTKYRRTQYRT